MRSLGVGKYNDRAITKGMTVDGKIPRGSVPINVIKNLIKRTRRGRGEIGARNTLLQRMVRKKNGRTQRMKEIGRSVLYWKQGT